MEESTELFLLRFSELKHMINNSPKNISWLAVQNQNLQDLCYELKRLYEVITKHIKTKDSKHYFAPRTFENQFKEYERVYHERVIEAAKPAEDRSLKEVENFLCNMKQEWLASGNTEEDFWKDFHEKIERANKKAGISSIGAAFDPLTDNPAFIMASLKDFLTDIIGVMQHEDDLYDKAFGAWDFFENTTGIDFASIYRRWRKAPELFIPPHLHFTNTAPLIELYHEAVRTYTFGNRIASVVMCRTLMEHILKKHYRCEDKNLQDIIALAERKFPNLKKFKMDKKRRFANDIVHEYENMQLTLEDKAVIEFLTTIKYLVQNVPVKK